MNAPNLLQVARTCTARDIPDHVDAGSDFVFCVDVSADPETDLAGQELQIIDSENKTLAKLTLLAPSEAGAPNTTGPISLAAPACAGQHSWILRAPPSETDDTSYLGTETEISVLVVAHQIDPVVWDVPSAVSPGETFQAKIGVRCSSACVTSGWIVSVRDHMSQVVARGKTGDTPWRGTEGLCYAEIDFVAPDGVGLFNWEAIVEAPEGELPHQHGSRRFGVRTTQPADARLRVEAVDAKSGAPVKGLKVMVHPFSARTGSDGISEIAVPSGDHRVFVSGKGYIPHRSECTVSGTYTMCVALEPDRALSEAEVWG